MALRYLTYLTFSLSSVLHSSQSGECFFRSQCMQSFVRKEGKGNGRQKTRPYLIYQSHDLISKLSFTHLAACWEHKADLISEPLHKLPLNMNALFPKTCLDHPLVFLMRLSKPVVFDTVGVFVTHIKGYVLKMGCAIIQPLNSLLYLCISIPFISFSDHFPHCLSLPDGSGTVICHWFSVSLCSHSTCFLLIWSIHHSHHLQTTL